MNRSDVDTLIVGNTQRDPKLRFAPGDLVARRYRLVRLIGAGGTGEVYEALDTTLGTAVALKTLNRAEAALPASPERFRRELLLSRRVTHPNVVRNFDLGEHDGAGKHVVFLTMELLNGENLESHLRSRGPMAPPEALAVAEQIAAGLDAAHEAGVIHRDVKPSNVMLLDTPETGRRRVVITDFGLARSDQMDMVALTASGDIVGTPVYMSPEQVRSGPITPASDIYSFGIVFYEMLSGKLPFVDTTAMAVALKRLRTPPVPIQEHLPDLDPAWGAAIARCLEVDPTRRWQRAGQLIDALGSQAASPGGPGRLSHFLRRLTPR